MTPSTVLPKEGPRSEALDWLFAAYTVAQADILEAEGPTAIRTTTESNVFEVEIVGQCSRAILTVAVTLLPDELLIKPVDFKVINMKMFYRSFSYDPSQPDAFIIKVMTRWLENTFLIHRDKIVAALQAALSTSVTRH